MTIGRPRTFDLEEAAERAMQVFWRRGFENASITELTRAIGINSPSLYAAFGSKEGLFRAALDRYSAVRAAFTRRALNARTARESVALMLRGSAARFAAPGSPKGCLLLPGGAACGLDADAAQVELAHRRAELEAMVRRRLERARREGDLPANADPSMLASYVAMIMHGLAVQASAGASQQQLRTLATMALAAFPDAPGAAESAATEARPRKPGRRKPGAGVLGTVQP